MAGNLENATADTQKRRDQAGQPYINIMPHRQAAPTR